jgi:WD40 repeat protein
MFKDPTICKDEDYQISRSFQEFCRFYMKNTEVVYRYEADMQKVDKEAREFLKDPETFLGDRNVPPMDIFSYSRKLNLNAKKVHNAFEVILLIRNVFEDTKRGLHRYANWIKHPDHLRRWEDIGYQANSKKITRPARIVWKFSKEDKLSAYEDHMDAIQDDLKAEKEARTILESVRRRDLLVVEGGKDMNNNKRLLTSQSAGHKETEVSQSDNVVKIGDDRKLVEKDFIIPEEEINVIVEKEIKPRVSREDYDYITEKENININLAKPTTTAYDNTFSKSYTIDNGTKKLQEKLLESQFQPSKTVLGGTMMTDSDTDKLRKELDEERKKNLELSSQIVKNGDRSQTLPLQRIFQTSQTIQNKYPVNLRQHIPLANWNLLLKNSVNASSQQNFKVIEVLPDLDYIVTGSKNGILTFWKTTSFDTITEHKSLNIGNTIGIRTLIYLQDGKTLLCGGKDGKINKIDVSIFTTKTICDLNHSINAMAYSLNGSSIYACSGNRLYEIDIINEKVLSYIDAHDSTIADMAYNQQKGIIVTGAKDKSIKIWQASNMECLGILQGHADLIRSLCFAYSKEHCYLVSVAKDSYITFWNLTDKNFTKSMRMSSLPKKVFYLWDKKTVATVLNNGNLTLWNIETNEIRELSGKGSYSTGSYCEDGHTVVLGTKDGTLEFWNAQ